MRMLPYGKWLVPGWCKRFGFSVAKRISLPAKVANLLGGSPDGVCTTGHNGSPASPRAAPPEPPLMHCLLREQVTNKRCAKASIYIRMLYIDVVVSGVQIPAADFAAAGETIP